MRKLITPAFFLSMILTSMFYTVIAADHPPGSMPQAATENTSDQLVYWWGGSCSGQCNVQRQICRDQCYYGPLHPTPCSRACNAHYKACLYSCRGLWGPIYR